METISQPSTQPRPRPTLEQLIQQSSRIYVLNRTSPVRTPILLTIVAPGMSPKTEEIPATWLPIPLDEFASPDVIAQNQDVRNLLRKRQMFLLWPDEASALLRKPEATEELTRLNMRSDDIVESVSTDGNRIAGDAFDGVARQARPVEPSDAVRSLVEQYRSAEVNARTVGHEIRTMADLLNAADVNYLLRNVDDAKVRELCSELLLEKRAQAVAQAVIQPSDVGAAVAADPADAFDPFAEAPGGTDALADEAARAVALAQQHEGAAASFDDARQQLMSRLSKKSR